MDQKNYFKENLKYAARLALSAGGIQDPSESQVEILVKIIELYVLQQVKGLEKYDQPIQPLDDYDWLEMKLEEQLDGAVYQMCELIKTKAERNVIKYGAIKSRLAQLVESGEVTIDEITDHLKRIKRE